MADDLERGGTLLATTSDHIQEIHIEILHIVRRLFPANYQDS